MCLSIQVDRPECVLSTGEHKGYEFVTVHNTMGFRCGYVRVPPGHPWHGKHYDAVDANAHGGITFADADKPCGKGGADNGWWIGFDCGHYDDAPDPSLPTIHKWSDGCWAGGTIRTQEYAENECRSLCEQAALAAVPQFTKINLPKQKE